MSSGPVTRTVVSSPRSSPVTGPSRPNPPGEPSTTRHASAGCSPVTSSTVAGRSSGIRKPVRRQERSTRDRTVKTHSRTSSTAAMPAASRATPSPGRALSTTLAAAGGGDQRQPHEGRVGTGRRAGRTRRLTADAVAAREPGRAYRPATRSPIGAGRVPAARCGASHRSTAAATTSTARVASPPRTGEPPASRTRAVSHSATDQPDSARRSRPAAMDRARQCGARRAGGVGQVRGRGALAGRGVGPVAVGRHRSGSACDRQVDRRPDRSLGRALAQPGAEWSTRREGVVAEQRGPDHGGVGLPAPQPGGGGTTPEPGIEQLAARRAEAVPVERFGPADDPGGAGGERTAAAGDTPPAGSARAETNSTASQASCSAVSVSSGRTTTTAGSRSSGTSRPGGTTSATGPEAAAIAEVVRATSSGTPPRCMTTPIRRADPSEPGSSRCRADAVGVRAIATAPPRPHSSAATRTTTSGHRCGAACVRTTVAAAPVTSAAAIAHHCPARGVPGSFILGPVGGPTGELRERRAATTRRRPTWRRRRAVGTARRHRPDRRWW